MASVETLVPLSSSNESLAPLARSEHANMKRRLVTSSNARDSALHIPYVGWFAR